MIAKIKAIPLFCIQLIRSLPLPTWVTLIALTLFLVSWIFGNHGLHELERLIRMKRGLLNQQKILTEEKGTLETELKRLEDPDYIKHLIHKEMGFVEKGEVIIKFPSKK